MNIIYRLDFIFLLVCSCIIGCQNNKKPVEKIGTNSVNGREEIQLGKIDTILLRKIEGMNLVDLDTKSKCNLSTARYLLNSVVIDSLEIIFVLHYLAQKLMSTQISDPNCPYPVMRQIYLYVNDEDYKLKFNIASYSFSPLYGEDFYVNSHKLMEIRSSE